MLRTLRKSVVTKIVALYLVFTMVFDGLLVTSSYALTGGPSQPEVASFEPIATNQMVDLFSGDFTYNIPLMTVPGPNGGYPINIAYHGGIGLEQEASWVGLGWNINPGAINRNMRGLPDDFNGEIIEKEFTYKGSQSYSLEFSSKELKEIFGFDKSKLTPTGFDKVQVKYNNYKGFGLKLKPGGFGKLPPEEGNAGTGKSGNSIVGELDFPFPAKGQYLNWKNKAWIGGLSFKRYLESSLVGRIISRSGTDKLIYKEHNPKKNKDKWNFSNLARVGREIGQKFAYMQSSPVPSVNMPTWGLNLSAKVELGKASNFTYTDNLNLTLLIEQGHLKTRNRDLRGYGYLYSQEKSGEDGIMDFQRENNIPVSKKNKTMSMPIANPDMYVIQGQGTGGVFRSFRNDIGVYSSEVTRGENYGVSGGYEQALSSNSLPPPFISQFNFHAGIDGEVSFGQSYSGPWKNNTNQLNATQFGFNFPNVVNENAYFKMTGEMTAKPEKLYQNVGFEAPINYRLSTVNIANEYSSLSFEPLVHNHRVNAPNSTITNGREYDRKRDRRSQHIAYRTIGHLNTDEYTSNADRTPQLFDASIYPEVIGDLGSAAANTSNSYPITYSENGNQIGEMTVTEPDGTRYTYGLPNYTSREDVNFDVKSPNPNNLLHYPAVINYDNEEASIDNNSGKRHSYGSVTTPKYAHSYLLTQVTSQDYIDLTGDGPTEDDLGYYTKFNYTKHSGNYKWRAPYGGATYGKGYYSDNKDDRASFSYGEKDIYYVNSIETKTHIAVFVLSDRHDGIGAAGRDDQLGQVALGQREHLKKLDQIRLYSKADLRANAANVKPIQVVHFKYDYSLCKNVPNNDELGNNNDGGKLTLKKLFFSYRGNDKGRLSPYQFDYENGLTYANPNYDDGAFSPKFASYNMDRWGNFVSEKNDPNRYVYTENPYVVQEDDYDLDGTYQPTIDEEKRHQDAAAWNLRKITLPSGGIINVDYEADDYAYVQDKKATQMMEIVGTSKVPNDPTANPITTLSDARITSSLGKNRKRIYFRMERNANSPADVLAYLTDLDEDVLFKTWMELRRKGDSGDLAEDYVSGYCKIDRSSYGYLTGEPNIGWVTVKTETVSKQILGANVPVTLDIHPFRKAGLQYLKVERSDLEQAPNFGQQVTVSLVIDLISKIKSLLNEYNVGLLKGHCKKLGTAKPSYIRLASPDGKKYGGGCRVSRVAIQDNWIENADKGDANFEYGQTYDYVTTDGKSSGVAEYEPLVGGEENPFTKPQWFNGNDELMNYRNSGIYPDTPLGQSYFPGASVGYSRIVVRNIERDVDQDASNGYEVTKTASGVSVSEYYTAKDFPILLHQTSLETKGYKTPPIPIPGIGAIGIENRGYSQGFKVELNNMHGKIKSTAVYPYGSNLLGAPTSKKEMIYNTVNQYNPNQSNRLQNKVNVLTADGVYDEMLLGYDMEFFSDEEEESNYNVSLGLNVNADVTLITASPPLIPIFIGIVTAIPSFDYHKKLYRGISTTKVIHRNGILKEVKSYADGAYTTISNEMFDAETGKAILTKTTNQYEDPVYTYEFPAHWNYDGMNGAYLNQGTILEVSPGNVLLNPQGNPVDDLTELLSVGDELIAQPSGEHFFVTHLNTIGGTFNMERANGSSYTASTQEKFYVYRSGRRNLQSATAGAVTALKNPVTERTPTALSTWNALVENQEATNTYNHTACYGDGTVEQVGWAIENVGDKPTIILNFSGGDDCDLVAHFRGREVLPGQVTDYTFELNGDQIIATPAHDPAADVLYGTVVQADDCYRLSCLDVLQASAITYRDDWTYDYADVGSPKVSLTSGNNNLVALNQSVGSNYRFGRKGIWRSQEAFAYQIDRKRSNITDRTNIGKNGEFEKFNIFNWKSPTMEDNPNWLLTNEMTRYSPYGFDLENRNILGIYSSEMLGYQNSVITAVGSNARYYELAYDGFEDYDGPYPGQNWTVGHGHLNLTNATVVNTEAHTGSKSLEYTAPMSLVEADGTALNVLSESSYGGNGVFTPIANKKYVISAWVKTDGVPTIYVNGSPATVTNEKYPEIEGWRKVEAAFTTTAQPSINGLDLNLQITGHSFGFVDDIRIYPFEGGAMTYVYDPVTLWLVATLDNRNYATFYIYDEEGALVQTKQETRDGIVTLSTSRTHTNRNHQ